MDKEKYLKFYMELVKKDMEEHLLNGGTKDDYETSNLDGSLDTDGIVGYYICNYGEEALDVWLMNCANSPDSSWSLNKDVDRILKGMYGYLDVDKLSEDETVLEVRCDHEKLGLKGTLYLLMNVYQYLPVSKGPKYVVAEIKNDFGTAKISKVFGCFVLSKEELTEVFTLSKKSLDEIKGEFKKEYNTVLYAVK